MDSSRKIQIILDSVMVAGIVRRTNDEEVVEITQPFRGWRTSTPARHHRGSSSRSVVTKTKQPDSLIILQRLYRLCVVLEENKAMIIESFEDVEVLIASLHAEGLVNDGMFEAFRKVFHLLHVDGDMTEKEYHNAMDRLRLQHSQYHHKRSQILDRWFREMFPDPIEDDGLREQIIRYLKQENRMDIGPSGKVTVRRC